MVRAPRIALGIRRDVEIRGSRLDSVLRRAHNEPIIRTLMSLSTGTKIGPYEIASLPGVGGMGEVYRSRDSKLGSSKGEDGHGVPLQRKGKRGTLEMQKAGGTEMICCLPPFFCGLRGWLGLIALERVEEGD